MKFNGKVIFLKWDASLNRFLIASHYFERTARLNINQLWSNASWAVVFYLLLVDSPPLSYRRCVFTFDTTLRRDMQKLLTGCFIPRVLLVLLGYTEIEIYVYIQTMILTLQTVVDLQRKLFLSLSFSSSNLKIEKKGMAVLI